MQKAFTVQTFCLTNYSRAKKIKYASLEMSNKTIKDVEHLTRHKSLFVDQNSNTLLGYKKRTSAKNNFDFHNTFFKKFYFL